MFISGHFHLLGMPMTSKYISCVAIGKLELQMHRVSYCGSKQKQRSF